MKITTSIIGLLSLIISIHGLRARINKGSDAPEGGFPYHVYLVAAVKESNRDVTYDCGGSIIDKRWILTAAHCFKKVSDCTKIKAYVGSVQRISPRGNVYSVKKRIVHEGFNASTLLNDIALLRVAKDIKFTDKIGPVALASEGTTIRDNEKVLFAGFGLLGENEELPDRLQAALLRMFTYNVCKLVVSTMAETQICTLPFNGKGPRNGDSGGALVNQQLIQVGIDSYRYKDTPEYTEYAPEVYTRVSYYRDWIEDTMINCKMNVKSACYCL